MRCSASNGGGGVSRARARVHVHALVAYMHARDSMASSAACVFCIATDTRTCLPLLSGAISTLVETRDVGRCFPHSALAAPKRENAILVGRA